MCYALMLLCCFPCIKYKVEKANKEIKKDCKKRDEEYKKEFEKMQQLAFKENCDKLEEYMKNNE